jgi:hypothetical protein
MKSLHFGLIKMNSRATLSLAAGLIVSAAALYASHDTQRDTCIAMQRQAIASAQAPIQPKATETLGFTPMSQFNKVYPPVCQPPNTEADVFSSLVAGILVAFACYSISSLAARFKSNHKEHS